MPGCNGTGMAEKSYPSPRSGVAARRSYPTPLHPRPGAVARRTNPMPEARGSSWEELPHT